MNITYCQDWVSELISCSKYSECPHVLCDKISSLANKVKLREHNKVKGLVEIICPDLQSK